MEWIFRFKKGGIKVFENSKCLWEQMEKKFELKFKSDKEYHTYIKHNLLGIDIFDDDYLEITFTADDFIDDDYNMRKAPPGEEIVQDHTSG